MLCFIQNGQLEKQQKRKRQKQHLNNWYHNDAHSPGDGVGVTVGTAQQMGNYNNKILTTNEKDFIEIKRM